MDDGDPMGRHLQLMQRLLQSQRGAGGTEAAAELAQAMAQMTRGFGGGGVGSDQGPRGRARQSMAKILANISNVEDDSDQYSGLSELCNQLNMATEDVLAAIRPDAFVSPIAACLAKEYNPELQLLAARCLTYMVDAIPMTAVALTSTNAIDLLLDRLRAVMDVELSEQCLTCVEKISGEVAGSILSKGGISAILSFVDFFGLSIQRKAWATVATLSKKLKPDQVKKTRDVLPQIRQSVTHEDAKIRESSIQTLYRIILTIRADADMVTDVFGECGFGVMEVIGRGYGGDACFPAALQLALAAVSYSPLVASGLIDIGFAAQMSDLISSFGAVADATPTSRTAASPINASPLGNSESTAVGTTPPSIATPLRSTLSASPEQLTGSTPQGRLSKQQKTLTPDMQKQICAILTALLPRISDGYMPFLATLTTLQVSAGGGAAQPRGFAHAASEVNIDALETGAAANLALEDDDEEQPADDDVDESTLRAELEELIVNQDWVRIETQNEKHRHCRGGRHSCDVCGAPQLSQNNWFRCNDCADFDICLSCMVNEGNDHHPGDRHQDDDDDDDEDEDEDSHAVEAESGDDDATDSQQRHTFTDMSAAVLIDASREAAQKIIRDATSKRALSDPRIQTFADAPYFVQRVVEALPNVIRLRLDSEHPRVQFYAFAYVARAVHFGTPEDLRRVLVDAPLCEAIVTALGDKDSAQNQVTALYIASQLVEKLPDIYCNLFIREGVTNGLASMKSSAMTSLSKQQSTPPLSPLLSLEGQVVDVKQCCSSKDGWNRLICAEVSKVLSLFPTLNDPTRSNMWASVCHLLKQKTQSSCLEAFEKMRLLMADASTFELMNCSVLSDLRQAMQAAEIPIATVVDFVFILSRDAPQVSSTETTISDGQQLTVTPFTKFVRLLQSTLSQLESFKPAKFSSVSGISSQLRLNIMPHNAAQFATERSNKQFPKPAELAAVTSDQSGTESAPVSPVSPAASTPSSEGRQAQVSIEPLAGLNGVIDFIRQNLLPNSTRAARPGSAAARGEGAEGEDDVEEVLPPNQRAAPNRASSPTAAPPQQLYLRIGRYALPPTMTMLQISQRYGKKSTEEGNANRERRRQLREVPAELRALLEAAEQQPMVIHYSTVPWGRDVRPVEDASDSRRVGLPAHGVSPSDPIHFVSIGERVVSEGCVNIRNAVFCKFEESRRFLSPNIEDVLSLLGIFFNAVSFWDCISMCMKLMGRNTEGLTAPGTSPMEFVNVKLNSKAMRHSSVLLLAGQHQSTWAVNLAMDCNFLFTAETRKFLFEVSFFGTARSLVRMQEYLQDNGGGSFSADLSGSSSGDAARRQHRLQRIKKRVWRERCLDCAVDVFNGQRGLGNAILEFEFYNEEGSGLGPTLEFFTLTGDAFRERKYKLWRSNDEEPDDKYFQSPRGLFPKPLPSSHPDLEKAKLYFRVMGRFLARAILDRRIPNIRLSRPLIKILRGDIVSFDQLEVVSERLFSFMKRTLVENCVFHPDGFNGKSTLDEMGLTFVAPGDDDIELIPGGADKVVDRSNVLEYINCVTRFLLKTGIEPLTTELRSGFHEIVPLHALRILSVEEIQSMMDGHTALVTLEELEQNCAADHGFTLNSQPVRWLFESISAMPPKTQQRFFQFLTGSPYLPVGGLRCLRPRLTIVRKTTTDSTVNEFDQLPSAMTCQNYLKLPAYESKEVLESKLLKAIEEGCGVFLFT
jgi:E3 ubiquitin-protein ligase TRIP12